MLKLKIYVGISKFHFFVLFLLNVSDFFFSDILTDTVTKSSFRQTDPIYGYLNASRELIYSPTWGYYRNGSYGGMIAEMTIGDADLAGFL